MTTPKLALPELIVGQAGKELTHNQALAIIDQLTQATVVDKDLAAPPGSPANGSMYIIAASATGAWSGQSGKLAVWLTSVAAWTFITPANGWSVWVTDESARYELKAGSWSIASSGGATLPVVQALSSTRALALVDINTFNVNSTTNNYTATIPAQSTAAWTADAEMHFLPSNTGDITVTAASGVSLNGVVSGSLTLSTQNGAATLKRVGADSWWIGGVIGTAADQRDSLGLGSANSPTFSTLTLSSGQVAFPAVQVPSANANTLDDYEEGTWTPALTFATPGNLSVAYTVQAGSYTKIGREVEIRFAMLTSSFTHTTASGALQLTGVPFPNSAYIGSRGALDWGGITKAAYTHVNAALPGGSSTLAFNASGSGQPVSAVTATDTQTGGSVSLFGAISYMV